MTNTGRNAVNSIDALSVAAEFLLCAIRALAQGADPQGQDVQDPVKWAQAKINEGVTLMKGAN